MARWNQGGGVQTDVEKGIFGTAVSARHQRRKERKWSINRPFCFILLDTVTTGEISMQISNCVVCMYSNVTVKKGKWAQSPLLRQKVVIDTWWERKASSLKGKTLSISTTLLQPGRPWASLAKLYSFFLKKKKKKNKLKKNTPWRLFALINFLIERKSTQLGGEGGESTWEG